MHTPTHAQLLAVLKDAAPGTLAGLPPWASKGECGQEDEEEEEEESSSTSRRSSEDEDGLSGGDAGLGAPGSLARELRRKVFALEETVFSLEGKLRLADEARLERGGGGDGDGAASTVVAAYDGRGQASSCGKGERTRAWAETNPDCQCPVPVSPLRRRVLLCMHAGFFFARLCCCRYDRPAGKTDKEGDATRYESLPSQAFRLLSSIG